MFTGSIRAGACLKGSDRMQEKKAELQEGKITPESLDEFRKRIGMELRIPNLYNTEVTEDSVRHFCDGIGDTNPLYRDIEYAKKTRYKGLIAPPSWLYSVFPTWVLQGLRGVHGFHAGNDWEFYRPIRVGDKIKPKCFFTGFEEKKSEFAETIIMEYQEAQYFNQNNLLLAKAKTWIVQAERKTARDKGKYSKIQLPHPWTEEELKKVEEDILSEKVRGAEPRYWEDVAEGEELTPVVKGPLGLSDIVAYCAGASPVQLLNYIRNTLLGVFATLLLLRWNLYIVCIITSQRLMRRGCPIHTMWVSSGTPGLYNCLQTGWEMKDG